jgi:hypothetical protein
MKRTVLICAVFTVLAVGTSVATALRSIQISNPGAFRTTGSNISFEEEERFLRTVCSGATLNGSLNERIVKTNGASVGTITEGRSTGCRAFGFAAATLTFTMEPSNPALKRFVSFLGTLPFSITGILYVDINIGFKIEAAGRTCRYAGTVGLLYVNTPGISGMVSLTWLPEPKPRLQPGSTETCPIEGSLRGTKTAERSRTVGLA